jgi:hypothetical protein
MEVNMETQKEQKIKQSMKTLLEKLEKRHEVSKRHESKIKEFMLYNFFYSYTITKKFI